MAVKLYDLARMTTATTGTGAVTLGVAVPPFLTFDLAGIADGDLVSYSIIDGVAGSEVGRGVYTAAGTTLTRGPLVSTNANAAISLSGSAQVLITALAEDITTAGLWTNTRLAKTANYTMANADKGSTVALGGAAYFALTFSAASGYDANFAVYVVNEDTARAKKIVISGGTTFTLWPGQTATVYAQNNVWKVDRPNRWILPASQNIYVDTTSGADDGTTDGMSSSSAFLTYENAYSVVQSQWDLAGLYTVTCNVVAASKVLTSGITLYGPLTGARNVAKPSFIIKGAGPGSTTISSSTNSLLIFFLQGGAQVSIEDMRLESSGTDGICVCVGNGWAHINNLYFGATSKAHLNAASPQALITGGSTGFIILTTGSVNISVIAEDHAQISLACPIICSGAPHFATAFAQADLGGFIDFTGATVTKASATGKCAQALSLGIVFVPGGGLQTLPGNANATGTGGGQYLN